MEDQNSKIFWGLFFFLSWFWDLSFFFIPLSGVAAYFGFLFGIVLFCCLYQVPRLTVTVQEREKETNSDMCRVPVFVCSGCGEWVRHRFCAPRYCSLKSCTKSSETGRGIKDQPCQPGCSPLRCGTLVTTLLKCYDCANFVHTETEDACLAAEEEAKGAAEAVDEPPPPPPPAEASPNPGQLTSQQLAAAADRLMLFWKDHLGPADQLRLDSRIDQDGLRRKLRIRWWLDSVQHEDEDSDSEEELTLLEQIPDRREPTVSQQYEEDYSARLQLWRDKSRQLRIHLLPEFRLACVQINSSLMALRASVWPIPPEVRQV